MGAIDSPPGWPSAFRRLAAGIASNGRKSPNLEYDMLSHKMP